MKMPEYVMRTSFAAIMMAVVFNCTRPDSAAILDPNAFERKLAATPDRYLIDVRTPEEHREGYLEHSVLINIHERDFTDRLDQLDRSKPVFLYCASGIRSERAAAILDELGFREIYTLDGGTRDWIEAGKPLVKK